MRRGGGETGGKAVAVARRGVLRGLAALAPLALAACGFRPIYGPAAANEPAIADELAAIRVGLIADRFGQVLRRTLQQRLAAASGHATKAARWDLVVTPSFSAEGLGIQPDGAATRVRYIATANWTLLRLTPRETVANGFERAIDAFNIQPSQYFAADMSREAMERRLAEVLATEVVQRVALNFRGLQDGVAPRLIEPVPQAAPSDPSIIRPPGAIIPGQSLGEQGGLSGGIGPAGAVR
ncbi:LPS assembly lipoprotein LptE [Roseomonas sp. AR75]|jgi:LPS-assembly lipoprotein|uniref:LPS assembly lipoprotein LptE n=1 Tax=Roseomonas sp. AR75 TaxID=2562311 RepID=UPI0010C15318|nr:LPS assembly lipoprotein LptE [Roseomonas sp. AR75]